MLRYLELKIPPVIIAAFVLGNMWWVSRVTDSFEISRTLRISGAVIVFATGIVIGSLGVASFLRLKTTINPHHPSRSSTLAVKGIYRFSRNPMYLGLLLCLLAVAAYQGNPYTAAIALLFIPMMDKLQIKPEERYLAKRFGDVYKSYCQNTRRWL